MRKFSETIVQIKITSATVIDGQIVTPGVIVEMVEDEAKQLMRLGKAELHAILDDNDGHSNDDNQEDDDDAAAQAAAAQAAAEATADATNADAEDAAAQAATAKADKKAKAK